MIKGETVGNMELNEETTRIMSQYKIMKDRAAWNSVGNVKKTIKCRRRADGACVFWSS